MKIHSLKTFTRGWFIGNFEPSLNKTNACEFAIKAYVAGEVEAPHLHKIAREYTLIVSGTFKINDKIVVEDDIIEQAPGEVASFSCVTSGKIAVVKLPSIAGDKYLTET